MSPAFRLPRILVVAFAALSLTACALPRSGPSSGEITAAAPDLPFTVVPITPAITEATRQEPVLGFTRRFTETALVSTELIAAGDVLSVTVWENSEAGLLSATGIGSTTMPDVRVSRSGTIHVPYVGRVRAAGRTPASLARAIREQLSERVLNPQVDVFTHPSEARQVSVQGVVGAPGIYNIRGTSRTLLPMLAEAGGVSADPEVVRLSLRRGAETGQVWLQDLYDRPEMNVPLAPGDAVIAERDRRAFTALGAVGQTTRVPFPHRRLSLADALGQIGGLRDDFADPSGVFVFRDESAGVMARLDAASRPTSGQARGKVVYILDLTRPGGMFLARDFIMRDGDTLYATTAPFVRFRQVLQTIAPAIGLAGSARSLGGF
ncbi:MAG: polysaccharide biosynthesis/export family protein [Pseudomonadota bacterium]